MKKIVAVLSLGLVALLIYGWVSPTPSNTNDEPNIADAEKNYAQFCAGCHGEKMDAFVDRNWKHGKTHDDLYKAIKLGYENEGMPAFDSGLTHTEIKELADYMLKGIENVSKYAFKPEPLPARWKSDGQTVKLDTVFSGIQSPWGFAFLPKGEMLIADKKGKLFLIKKNRTVVPIQGVPSVSSDGQGGLMDVVLHPAFKQNKWIYLSYSAIIPKPGGQEKTTAIIRARLKGDKLENIQPIFEAFPSSRTSHHYGSRMVFDNYGYLYFSVGERGNEKENPQDLGRDLGKIHRLNDDGTVPADNPFVNTPGARASIFSYGHRNPQGIALHPQTGEIWSHEHGPRGGDELNKVMKGANYGWPTVTYGINYNGKVISNFSVKEGIQDPLKYWLPSIAPSGMAFVTGNRYPAWKGNLMVGSLRFKYLNRCIMQGETVATEEILLKNIGRLRDVRMGPDGYLYVSVENPGAVLRLVPVN